MNSIYKVIFNATLGIWVAVSEITQGRKKTKSQSTSSVNTVAPRGAKQLLLLGSFLGVMSGVSAQTLVQGTGPGMAISLDTCGTAASTSNKSSYASGCGSHAGDDSLAIGTGAKTLFPEPGTYKSSNNYTNHNKRSIAIGTNAVTMASDNIAIGTDSYAGRSTTYRLYNAGNIAIGNYAKISEPSAHSVAIGYHADLEGWASVAIGKDAYVRGSNNVVIGLKASAKDRDDPTYYRVNRNVVLGSEATSTSDGGVAIGYLASTPRVEGRNYPSRGPVAIGLGALASVNAGVALGYNSTADREGLKSSTKKNVYGISDKSVENTIQGYSGAVSVGHSGDNRSVQAHAGYYGTARPTTRQIINVAPGSEDSDAVNVAQLKWVKTSSSDVDLSNITDDGKDVIRSLMPVVKVEAGDNIRVEQQSNGNEQIFTVHADAVTSLGTPFHYVSINDGGDVQSNYNNEGAAGSTNSIAIGPGASTLKGTHGQLAVGAFAKTNGVATVALGTNAYAAGTDAVSVGNNAGSGSSGITNIAVGALAGRYISGNENISIGRWSGEEIDTNENIAIGYRAARFVKDGDYSKSRLGDVWGTGHNVAIGSSALNDVKGASNTAVGTAAGRYTTGDGNTYLGLLAGAGSGDNDRSVVIGNSAFISGGDSTMSVMIGNAANAGVKGKFNRVVAIGNNSKATGEKSVAIGDKSAATGNDSVAVGVSTKSSSLGSTTVGSLSSVGEESFAAIAIGRGAQVGHKSGSSIAMGASVNVQGGASIGIGNETRVNGAEATVMGFRASGKQQGTAVGNYAEAAGVQAAAFGSLAKAYATTSTAIGPKVQAQQERAVGLGNQIVINSKESSAVGYANAISSAATNSHVLGSNNFLATSFNDKSEIDGAIGGGRNKAEIPVQGTAKQSVVLGNNNSLQSDNVMLLGNNVEVEQGMTGAVILGHDTDGSTQSKYVQVTEATVGDLTYGNFAGSGTLSDGAIVSVGAAGAERQIKNVAAGQISATSTDAINGSQLYAVAKQAAQPLTLMGNVNNDTDEDGTQQQLGSTLSIIGATSTPLSRLSVSADEATAGTYSARNLQTVVTDGQVQIQMAERPIFSGVQFGDSTGPQITSEGGHLKVANAAGDGPVKITNVAAGDVSATSTEVIVGSQLHAVAQQASSPLTFKGDTGKAFTRQLGDTINVVGGAGIATNLTEGNIGVEAKNGTLTVKLNKDLKLTERGSVIIGNTKLDQDGLVFNTTTIDPITNEETVIKNDNAPSISSSGIDAGKQTITNVADGQANSDAVNFGQLQAVSQEANRPLTFTGNVNNDTGEDGTQQSLGSTLSIIGATSTPLSRLSVSADEATAGTYSARNLQTVVTDGQVQIQMAERPIFSGVQFGDSTGPQITSEGGHLKVANAAGDGPVKITNVAAGEISDASTDVIVGSQLHAVAEQAAKPLTFAGDSGGSFESQLGDTVKVFGGADTNKLSDNNIGVVAHNGALNVRLSTELKDLTSAEFKDSANTTTVTSEGVSISDGPSLTRDSGLVIGDVTVTADGINAGNNVISGVADGVGDKDAVNMSQLNKVAQEASKAAAAAKSTIKAGQNIVVTSNTNADGSADYTVATADEVNFTKVTVGDTAGSQITIGGDSATISGLSNTSVGGTGFANSGRAATEEQLNATQTNLVTVLGGNAVNTNGNVTVSDLGGTGKNTVHDAIAAVHEQSQKPLTFTDDAGNQLSRQLGENLNIHGGSTGALTDNNIGVVASGDDTLTIKLAEQINLGDSGSLTVGDTVIAGGGLTVNTISATQIDSTSLSAGNGTLSVSEGSVAIAPNTTVDMGGNRIQNVAPGQAPTDAVNVQQVEQVVGSINNSINQLRGDLHTVDRNARAGIASAAAMANLPQPYLPGKSMFAIAGGGHRGEHGYAAGLSRITDNGKWILRSSVSGNTRGDVTYGAGVGYQW